MLTKKFIAYIFLILFIGIGYTLNLINLTESVKLILGIIFLLSGILSFLINIFCKKNKVLNNISWGTFVVVFIGYIIAIYKNIFLLYYFSLIFCVISMLLIILNENFKSKYFINQFLFLLGESFLIFGIIINIKSGWHLYIPNRVSFGYFIAFSFTLIFNYFFSFLGGFLCVFSVIFKKFYDKKHIE